MKGWHIWVHPNLAGMGLLDGDDPKVRYTVVTKFAGGQMDQEDVDTPGGAMAYLMFNAATHIGQFKEEPMPRANRVVLQVLASYYDGPYAPKLLVAIGSNEREVARVGTKGFDLVIPGRGPRAIHVPAPEEA